MGVVPKQTEQLRMILQASSGQAALAAEMVADHLGLSVETAASRLTLGKGLLAEEVPADKARKLAALLATCGILIRLDASPAPDAAGPEEELALQATGPVDPLIGRLAAVFGKSLRSVHARLTLPGGMVLRMSAAEANRLERLLSREPGLRVLRATPAVGTFDLFSLTAGTDPGLARLLRQLGLAPCRFSGAIATGLDHRSAAHVLARTGHLGLVAVNREFLRYDLLLTGTDGLPVQELADFLAIRCPQPMTRLRALSPSEPLRLETGLTRRAIQQFQADYGTIGLQTRVILNRPATDPAWKEI